MAMAGEQRNNFLGKFFNAESSGGILMIAAALLAIFFANNISTQIWYQLIISSQVMVGLGAWILMGSFDHLVKDILMVFFFLMVGMELKREVREGFLTDKKQVLLPLLAAIGGMVMPAAVFLLVNHNLRENWQGWAIPSATDIAFAICILMLAGKRVPPALKIFLLAIAIFDDLGAVLIIAIFYSTTIVVKPLLLGAAIIGLLYVLNQLRVMSVYAYMVAGIILWFCLYYGGIHTTIAGVAVGMAIPMRNPADSSHSPLNNFISALHPWVSFFILPIFAFTQAGVNLTNLNMQALLQPMVLGIACGLFIGKQVGIFGTTWLVVKSGLATLPQGTGWRHIYGVSLIAGIGFTMSLFIGALAFDNYAVKEQVKLGVITGSLFSAFFGWLVLSLSKPVKPH
jgi:NhaA family Na+:H+ antiporter